MKFAKSKISYGIIICFSLFLLLLVVNIEKIQAGAYSCEKLFSNALENVFKECIDNADINCSGPKAAQAKEEFQKCLNNKGLQGAAGSLQPISESYYGETPMTLEQVIGTVIKTALSLLGVIFLVLTIYGGYIWMTARGDEKEAEKAMGIIKMAVIGIVVVLSAYAIADFILWQVWST